MLPPLSSVDVDVTPDLVAETLGNTNLSHDILQVSINAATLLAARIDSSDIEGGGDAIELITLYLACHFAQLSEGQTEKESAGIWSATFMRKGGVGLQGSAFGQAAITLDSTGTIAQADLKKAIISVIHESETMDHEIEYDADVW